MDEQTERILTRFLQHHDEREFTYFNRGRLVVQSTGDGAATVSVESSVLGRSAGVWDCSSPEELFEALYAGMAMLCDEDDVDNTLEAFLDILSRQRRD